MCDVVTARACGFLNITRQTKGALQMYCVTGSLVSASDLIYCFSDIRDQSTRLLAVCNILPTESDVLT